MAGIPHFFVVVFSRTETNELRTEVVMKAHSERHAASLASHFSDEGQGAIAFSRSEDPSIAERGTVEILARFGDVLPYDPHFWALGGYPDTTSAHADLSARTMPVAHSLKRALSLIMPFAAQQGRSLREGSRLLRAIASLVAVALAASAELDRQRPPVPPQVPGHVRVVLPHSATDALGPKDADDVVPAQTPPRSPVSPTSLSASEAADEPPSPAPSAQQQQPAQAVQAAAAAAEPPRASTADAVDDRRGAESRAGAGASLVPIFMRVPQLPTVRDEGFAPRPQAVRRREARLPEEFWAHRAAHSYHYRHVMVRRWAPANPFVRLARLLFH